MIELLPLDRQTHLMTVKPWRMLMTVSDMLAEIIAEHKWREYHEDGVDPHDKKYQHTISTDSKHLAINPAWWENWLLKERGFLLAHEACHPIQGAWDTHRFSEEMRKEPKRLGRAQDLSINGLLEEDKNISVFLTPRLKEVGWFPSKHGWPNGLQVADYFERLGPQKDEDPDWKSFAEKMASQQCDPNGDSDDRDDDQDGNSKLETQEMEARIKKISQNSKLGQGLMKSVAPKEDAKAINNWRNILRDFLWKKTREERSRKKPSRRWDGKGPVLSGKSSRVFPKTVLILDYSSSMREFISACAESVTNLICTFTQTEIYIIANSNRIVYEWVVQRNGTPPTTEELLSKFDGGGTQMMPAIKRAKELGAELILCVSDMETEPEDIECDDVYWITTKDNSCIDFWRKRSGKPTKRVFDVLLID